MRPAARAAAAIGLLEQILSTTAAADRLLAAWGRENRYAGAKDRRAIAELVYTALRLPPGTPAMPRVMVWRALQSGGQSPDEAAAMFDGGPHAPAPLSPDELSTDAATGDALSAALQRAFGDRAQDETAALFARAPLDLRVNTLKAAPGQVLHALQHDGIEAAQVSPPDTCLRIEGNPRLAITGAAAYLQGLIEIQDRGAQLVCAACNASPGMVVVDLCAGAGGKSLALAAAMQNTGRILACDTDPGRLKRLQPRAARAGATIISERLLAPSWMQDASALHDMHGAADIVMVDAPCSGSGTWRRNPETRWRLTAAALKSYAQIQSELLHGALPLLKPGGLLVYVTCSVLREENDDVAGAFAAAAPVRAVSPAWSGAQAFLDGPYLRLSPLSSATDGFFAAFFRKL